MGSLMPINVGNGYGFVLWRLRHNTEAFWLGD